MNVKSAILGACATGMAVTGAFASFFSSAPISGYVQVNGATFYSVPDGISCGTGSVRCQVKTVDADGDTISTATTLFSTQSTNSPILGSSGVKGTVTLPI